MKKKIVVIGAGSVGLTTAYYLLKEGYDVTILEKNGSPGGCSWGNAGMIVPSHFIPLAAPGIVSRGVKWLFNPESPFHIKPSADPRLAFWLLKFFRSSTKRHVLDSMEMLGRLNLESRNLFEELSATFDTGFSAAGLMILANTEKGLKEEMEIVKLAPRAGIMAEPLSRSEAEKMQPGVRLNISGGVYFSQDASIDPALYLSGLSEYLTSNGARIVYNAEVKGFIIKERKISHIITGAGDFTSHEVILAAGAWSSRVTATLGVSLPVIAGKGYSVTLNDPVKQLKIPVILSEARIAVTPMGEMVRFAGTMELSGNNIAVDQRRLKGMIGNIPSYLPDFNAEQFAEKHIWAGLRPVSSDGLPYIGRFAKYHNLIAATGHSMMGISLSPVTGKIVEELVSGKPHSFNIARLSPARARQ
jgi:D-amino-acid dehydrogenase